MLLTAVINFQHGVFGWPFVKRFALCYRTVVLSCLTVTSVYCGQTVGRIKMKLGTQVGLGSGHIVLDGDPAPPPPKGHSLQFSSRICCCQMAAWIKMPLGMDVGLGPGDCVRWGPHSTLRNRWQSPSKKFLAHVYCGPTAGWIKMALGMEVGLSPGDFVLHGDHSPSPKRGCSPPIFRPMSIAVKWLHGSRCHLVRR